MKIHQWSWATIKYIRPVIHPIFFYLILTKGNIPKKKVGKLRTASKVEMSDIMVHQMKMSNYLSVFDTLWNLGLLFLKTPPPPLILNFSQLKLGTFLIFWRPPSLKCQIPKFRCFFDWKASLRESRCIDG